MFDGGRPRRFSFASSLSAFCWSVSFSAVDFLRPFGLCNLDIADSIGVSFPVFDLGLNVVKL